MRLYFKILLLTLLLLLTIALLLHKKDEYHNRIAEVTICLSITTVFTARDYINIVSVSEKAGRAVVFCATGIDTEKTVYGKPIVFNTVKVNAGGCYDNTTGVFTTTLPGTYVFTATVGSGEDDSFVAARITEDGTDHTVLYGSLTSTGSSSVSVQLGLGQRVWVMSESDADKYSSYYPCFTGALVLPQLCPVDDDNNDHDIVC